MSVLQELLRSRDEAQAAYDAFVNPLIEAGTDLTDEQETKRGELRTAVEALDDRIDEVDAKERRTAKLTEVRTRINAGVGNPEVTEHRTYEEGSPNSYFADMVRASNPMFKGHDEARERLNNHAYEVSLEVARGTKEGKRALRQLREAHRTENGTDTRQAIEEVRARGNAGAARGREGTQEARTGLGTGTGSGAAFVTPVYLVNNYAPYREAGRAFIDQANKQPMPDYGMTIYIPAVNARAGVAAQTENAAVTENDPTAAYLSAPVTTEAGQVIVSQQLLDRSGPNFAFDQMIFDQLHRDYAPKADLLTLTTALAGAGAITYTDASGFTLTTRTAPGAGGFYSKVSGAKAAVRTAAGTVMNPTHLFLQPTRWEYISAWADTSGRPVVVPDYAGPNNALAGGSNDGDAGYEGRTGYRMNGLPVFHDLNIPTPGTGSDQAIVANMQEVYVWEGDLTPRVIPQTYAQNLQVLLQVYAYIAVLPRYPLAVQTISGSGMSAITF